MALGLALTGLTDKENGKKLWTLETVSWWNELELIKDPRFKKLDLGEGKWVYEAILSLVEVYDLNNKYKKDFLGTFAGDSLTDSYHKRRKKMVDELEEKLGHPKTRYVSVWIFEWDY